MRLLFHFRWLLVFACWLGTLAAAHASHILGGEITYYPVTSSSSTPRYHVTVQLYRDPAGVSLGAIDLMCSRSGCDGTTPGSFAQTLSVSQLSSTYSLGCSGGIVYRYEVYTYDTEVTLLPGQWTLSVNQENRASGIVNLTNSATQSIYISAFLDNATVTQNASPRFLSTLLPYLCNFQAQRYSFSAFESDGDSLVYTLVYPQRGIPPASKCGADVIGTLSPHFQINAATGALTAQTGPITQGRYAMAARITEYRRINNTWQLIGNVTRDVTYLAYIGNNANPQFTGITLGNNSTSQPVGQLIRVQPGQTVNMTFSATDPDAGQAIRFVSQSVNVIPGLTLTTLNATQARLTWQVPATLPLGRYTATIAVLDNGCSLNASEEQTISFLVTNQTLATQPAEALEKSAFPMPFREQVQFRAAGGGQAITIVDNLGRVVAHLRSDADGRVVWMPTAALPAGLYLARGADGRALARLLRAGN